MNLLLLSCRVGATSADGMELLFGVVDKTLMEHVRGVKQYFVHPEYVANVASDISPHDIAILELSEPLTYDKACRPICLPNPLGSDLLTNCWSVGWGFKSHEGGEYILFTLYGSPYDATTRRSLAIQLDQGYRTENSLSRMSI